MLRKLTAATILALSLAAAAVGTVAADAGNVTPCLNGAAYPGVFGALYGSSLDAATQAHEDQPLGGTLSGFAHLHSDGDCD
jgi:hypothetical protein